MNCIRVCQKPQQRDMAGNQVQAFELKYSVQSYAWGKKGNDSAVARLKASADPSFQVKDDQTYAELWMGTHPNGPSVVCLPEKTETSLSDWLKNHPEQLGSEVNKYFHGALPFLFKVLSVRTALSIQAHPNKKHAEQLHRDHPDLYKDDNHKPEMAIALTPFMGLCGFRPTAEIAAFVQEIPELRSALGDAASDALITGSKSSDAATQRDALKQAFAALMKRDETEVKQSLKALVSRIQTEKSSGSDVSKMEGDLLLKLNSEFPGDRGGLAIYFLNVLRLQAGEAMFLEANLPHAYLEGDCMECMATSDNVVRAGLTPKHVAVETLLGMLDYTPRPESRTKFSGIVGDCDGVSITNFNPPVPDFGVSKYEVPAGQSKFTLHSIESASICIIVSGKGEATGGSLSQGETIKLRLGTVVFVAAQASLDVNVSSEEGMLLFRAYAGVI